MISRFCSEAMAMATGTTLMNLSLKTRIEAEKIIKGQWMSGLLGHFLKQCIFNVISVGPIPTHIAFIMDGNRRFEKKHKLPQGEGHKAGFTSLKVMLSHCYLLGVKYVTVYAFSIENFKRNPDEVQLIMDLLLEKIEELLQDESILYLYGIKLHFVGNLMLLTDKVRAAALKAMELTEGNDKAVLVICFAYTSTDEMAHAVDESCQEKLAEVGKKFDFAAENEGETEIEVEKRNGFVEHGEEQVIRLSDVEKNMYMAVAPDPDFVIRSSGQMRLSDFLTWQTSYSLLYSPADLWPDLSMWHLVWGVLCYQRSFAYLEKRKKQS